MIFTHVNASLRGFNVGMSGAVPERAGWSEPAQDRAILEFTALLSGLVIKYGGRIVHGSHPSLTPVIAHQAEVQAEQGTEKPLVLFMSELWSSQLEPAERAWYNQVSEFVTIPKVGDGDETDSETRNRSLTAMRRGLIQRMNSMVIVGGMQHTTNSFLPGIVEELTLARTRGMPCFLVGGFGGMTSRVVQELIGASASDLANGLSPEQNEALMTSTDIASCVSIIFSHLADNPNLADRPLANLED